MYAWLQRVWYDDAPSGVILRPFAWLFAAVAALRRRLYRQGILRSRDIGRPVIVVGNLSVGGTDKTPLTLWLAAQLADRGLRVGLASRGYGGTARAPKLVSATDDPTQVGDEPVLMARAGVAQVAVGADRVAVAQLLAGQGCEVIIADDGLQHLRLRRAMEIVVLDGARRYGNGRLLPAGPLREPAGRLGSVDAVVINGGSAQPAEFAMSLEPSPAVSLSEPRRERSLAAFSGERVHAIAAIGHPARFFDLLRRHGIEALEHPLPDHAALRREDVTFADALPVLMTEKDAVKCRAPGDERYWYVPVTAHLPEASRLLSMVLRAIGRADTRSGSVDRAGAR